MSVRIPFPRYAPSRIGSARVVSHERVAKDARGVFQCELTTASPLCLRAHFEKLKRELPGNPARAYLTASSIRGAVRAMAEALGAGCGRYYGKGGISRGPMKTCDENGICPCCRIFGFAPEHETFAWASKVHFEDTEVAAVKWKRYAVPPFGGEAAAADVDGWLIFRHLAPPVAAANGEECVDTGAVFPFRVRYHNLTPDEMALFYHALTLGGLYHVIGFGKRCGLGACRIRVTNPPSPAPDSSRVIDAAAWAAIQKARGEL